METDKKKINACVSLTVFCFSCTRLIVETWESTSTFLFSGGTWFPLTVKLSYLKTLILMREKMVPRLSSDNALKFSTSSGLILLTELLPIVSFGKLLQGDFLLIFNKFFNHLLLHLFFSCAAELQKLPVLVKGQIRSFGTRMLMVSHLDFYFIFCNPNIK